MITKVPGTPSSNSSSDIPRRAPVILRSIEGWASNHKVYPGVSEMARSYGASAVDAPRTSVSDYYPRKVDSTRSRADPSVE